MLLISDKANEMIRIQLSVHSWCLDDSRFIPFSKENSDIRSLEDLELI